MSLRISSAVSPSRMTCSGVMPGDTVGACARARQHGARLLMRLGPHDVGNPEPLLIAVVGIDHAQHDDA